LTKLGIRFWDDAENPFNFSILAPLNLMKFYFQSRETRYWLCIGQGENMLGRWESKKVFESVNCMLKGIFEFGEEILLI
jgi:hypothetical protein